MKMQYDHKIVEKEVLDFWRKNRIFQKVRRKIKGKKQWSFIDGPITANNPMGVHHAWGRTYKDIYQRFKALQGYDQRFQNGFDCQGLWLEVETEKDLGFNSRKDIEHFGLDKFSRACRKRVDKFSKIQTEQSIKLGQWMDWDNSYYTMSDKNIEYIWYFLKKCHEKKWLYKGKKVLPWCTRCGTSSSQHEMSDEGYEELTHPAVYVKARIKDNEFLLIWTTTEWTLSSNVAVAINPNLDYAKVRQGKDIYYLSKATLKKLEGDYDVLKILKGKDLVGLRYESFYPDIDVQKGVEHIVVGWNDVGEEEGTGIVHIAPTCGAEDYELGKKENLPLIKSALDEEGNYYEGFGWLSHKNVKQLKKAIIEDLRERDLLYKVEDYTHRYPVCWRCKEDLVFRMSSEWFIKADGIRPLMKKAAKEVNWVPEHVGKLMQDWLDNMGDWNISRKRYWGLPLMFFECECGCLDVIGSLKELKEKAINKKEVGKLPELHRPWIDKIRIKCQNCKKEISRIKEVGDCWLDAGIVPFSTLKYFEDKRHWKKWFPAELVIEMRVQVRLWFYSLLFMAVTLEGKSPYRNVFAYEEVRDEKGKPMHKSLGNAIWFDDAVERMGADVMRWMYASQNPQFNLNFGYGFARDVNRYLIIIWNLGSYVKENCKKKSNEGDDVVSRWIISRREILKETVELSLEKLQPHTAMRKLKDYFIEDLSRTYVQMIRNDLDDPEVQTVLYNSYLDGLKLLSPFLPFITEKLYKEIYNRKESIFLEDWPDPNKKLIDNKLDGLFSAALMIIEKGLAEREKLGIGLKWPLAKATATLTTSIDAPNYLRDVIARQLNVKKFEMQLGGEFKVELDTKITKELEEEGYSRELTRMIQDMRKKSGLKKKDRIHLVVVSDYDVSKFKKEILEKVGAKKIEFLKEKPKKKYKNVSKKKIRDHGFEVMFNKV